MGTAVKAPVNIYHPPQINSLPVPVYCHTEVIPGNSECLAHQHEWGQFHYAATGDMILKIDGQQLLTPSNYGVWIPKRVGHSAFNSKDVHYQSLYVDSPFQETLPQQWHVILITSLLKGLLAEIEKMPKHYAPDSAHSRLMHVVIDQLKLAPKTRLWIPVCQDKLLNQIIPFLIKDPSDPRTLAQWAQTLHCSERTLARHFQDKLGISYNTWRQRNTFLAAIRLLDSSHQISQIAWQLGYESVSAFIAMFRRHAGMTPSTFRQSLNDRY